MERHAVPADRARLPRRVELELNPEVLAELSRRSKASGRSIDELAQELIDRALQQDSCAADLHPD